jgi:hypothetical protein
MMRKLPTDAKSNPSGKQNLFIVEQHHLPAVKKLLESENLHQLTEETMSDLTTELHELIIDIRKRSRGVLQEFNTSRDSLLKNLRRASIKLNLAWDQLESKGRTNRYYQNLLACKEYLEEAYEQYVRITIEGTNDIEDAHATATKQGNLFSLPRVTFLTRMRTYLQQLNDTEKWLQQIYELIGSEDELWADQCSHAIFYLHKISQHIQDTCTLLSDAEELLPGISQESYELMVKLYHVDEQAHETISIITSFRPVCQARTKQAEKMRVEILNKLQLLKQSYNAILQSMSLLLRKIKSSETLHSGHHNLVLINPSQ